MVLDRLNDLEAAVRALKQRVAVLEAPPAPPPADETPDEPAELDRYGRRK